MLKYGEESIREIAQHLLTMNPDPVPKYRLLQDLLKLDPTDDSLVSAAGHRDTSKWIEQLRESQWEDGTGKGRKRRNNRGPGFAKATPRQAEDENEDDGCRRRPRAPQVDSH